VLNGPFGFVLLWRWGRREKVTLLERRQPERIVQAVEEIPDLPDAREQHDGRRNLFPASQTAALARLLKRRRFLGAKAYVFGGVSGEYQGTIRTALESVVLLAQGVQPTRTRAHGRVNREPGRT